jgi:hypothetical protein
MVATLGHPTGVSNVLTTNIAIRIAAEASIIHPTRGRIRFHPYPYQTRLWMDTSRFRLILKARQIGVSQAVAAEALYKAMLIPHRTILFISKNGPDAIRLLKQARDIYDVLPTPPCKATKSILNELQFANGSSIISVAAQRNAGRGYPASDIYLDEAAFLQFAEDIYVSIMPAISEGGTMTILSTPNGQQGLFYDLWSGVMGDEWSKHRIPFWMCPTRDEEWYRTNRPPKMTISQFASEHECSFENSGDPVFREDGILAAAQGWQGPTFPYPGRFYVTSWDIARKRDWTVGTTLDATERVHQVVAWQREQGMKIPAQQELIAQRWAMYPGLHIIEGNNLGDSVLDAIPGPAAEHVITEMHLTQMINKGIPIPHNAIIAFQTQTRSKENIITALQLAVEAETWKCAIPEVLGEMRKYTRNDKKLVQDTIMSAAIGEWAANHVPVIQTMDFDERVDVSQWARNYAG